MIQLIQLILNGIWVQHIGDILFNTRGMCSFRRVPLPKPQGTSNLVLWIETWTTPGKSWLGLGPFFTRPASIPIPVYYISMLGRAWTRGSCPILSTGLSSSSLLSGSRGIILHFPTQQQNGWCSSWVCGKLKNQVVCSSHPKHAARRVHFGMSRTSQLLFHLLLTHSDPVQRHRGQPHIFSGWWF